ncbi:MAG: hypothetical protein IJW79_00230 [Clostridia bacterium]|nr:hypothetical protein [Clostridia bacterium]
MSKSCNNCEIAEKDFNVTVPYVVHEAAMARMERQSKRLWIVIIILIAALLVSNFAWIIYNSQFEVVEESTVIEQENGEGDNNYIGNDGDINNGETKDNNQEEIS